MNITAVTADVEPCETDFVIVGEGEGNRERRVPIAVGECKSRGEITGDDVRNLGRVADAFERTRMEPYILFAKTSSFTSEEIIRCKTIQGPHRRRVILLSDQELEPYFVYERTAKKFEIRTSAISFEDLAQATENIYFNPPRQ